MGKSNLKQPRMIFTNIVLLQKEAAISLQQHVGNIGVAINLGQASRINSKHTEILSDFAINL